MEQRKSYFLIDQSLLAGFQVYPDLGGFFISIDKALGKRTDFIEFDDFDDTLSTKWGKGFKLAAGYDFSRHLKTYPPVLALSLKSMPRGGSRDTILGVSLKFTRHK